jgi:hypothetical protein
VVLACSDVATRVRVDEGGGELEVSSSLVVGGWHVEVLVGEGRSSMSTWSASMRWW